MSIINNTVDRTKETRTNWEKLNNQIGAACRDAGAETGMFVELDAPDTDFVFSLEKTKAFQAAHIMWGNISERGNNTPGMTIHDVYDRMRESLNRLHETRGMASEAPEAWSTAIKQVGTYL